MSSSAVGTAPVIEAKPGVVSPVLSTEPVLAVRNIGKHYHIYARPQDRLKQSLLRWTGRRYYREFWALKGVSFEVRQGECVGILGRNGAGKSTLLQIVAGTLAPTTGEVGVRGRVAAMLQLGSGFNPEFTGRENVFLSGAVLGITRKEMLARFDRIAAFADIGDFLDQPLKTYSSGMQARLAFAVWLSVDPDLLIVDEILAVGDIGFQQKCIARLRSLRDNGLTMLFVSHSPDAVRSICQKAVFLVEGQPVFFGPAERATDLYLAHVRETTNREALEGEQSHLGKPIPLDTPVTGTHRYGSGHVQVESVQVLNRAGEPTRAFAFNEEVTIEATVRARVRVTGLNVSFLVRDMTGVDLMGTTTFDEEVSLPTLEAGQCVRVRFTFAAALRMGSYGICLAVNRVSRKDYSDVVLFDQVDGVAGFGVIPDPGRPVHYKYHQPVSVSWEVPDARA